MLHKFDSLEVARDGPGGCAPGRSTILGANLRGGGTVGCAGSREVRVEWPWDLDRERARIGGCESTVLLAWDPALGHTRPDAFAPVALRCGSRICPVCFAARSGRAFHRWAPVLDAALAEGAAVWHVTLTQRCEAVWGSAVLPSEAGRWLGVVPSAVTGDIPPAVAGESAGEAYARWRSTWHALRTSRAGRGGEWGSLLGVEWTLRSKRGGRAQQPRWHCHGHLLIVARDPAWRPEPLMEHWARLSGVGGRWTAGETKHGTEFVRYGGQYASRVTDRSGLVEVLKYPFKHGEVTAAGTIDIWAALRGAKTHVPGGALHKCSNLAKTEPWSTWLGADPEEQPWSMLEREVPLQEGRSDWAAVTRYDLGRMGDSQLRVQRPDGSYLQWSAQVDPWAARALTHPMLTVDADS